MQDKITATKFKRENAKESNNLTTSKRQPDYSDTFDRFNQIIKTK